MEVLVEKISRVQEGELSVGEFQVAVLTSLLSIMQDQARLPSGLLAPQSISLLHNTKHMPGTLQ